jgi:multiple sugar transport system permease protein
MKEWYTVVLLLAPSLFFLFSVILFPLGFSYYVSLTNFPLAEFRVTEWVGLDNYISILTSPRFWHSMAFTGVFVIIAVSIEFFLGLGFALLFDREIIGGKVLRSLILLPMLMSPLVVSMIWKYMLHVDVGIVNYILRSFNLPAPAWLSVEPYAIISVILIDVWQWTPFMFLVLTAGLVSLPREPIEAALIDGATKYQTFRHVILPLLKPVIFVAIMLRAMDALKVFDILYITTRGGPGIATESLTYYIFNLALERRSIGLSCAAGIIAVFLVFGFFSLYLKFKPKE